MVMNAKKIVILLCLLMGMVFSLQAENPTKTLSAAYTLWFPYNYQGENGKALGFENEIFLAVMDSMKIQVEFNMLPWKRCLHALQYGETDALVSMLMVDERKKYTIFSREPISVSKTLLFIRRESPIVFDGSFEKLKRYSFGTTRGFSYGKKFDDADYLKKEEVLNQQAIINKVVHGRNDIGIGNQLVIMGLAEKMGLSNDLKFLEPPVHMQELYVGFSRVKGLERMAEDFSEALARFKKTDDYLAILDKYGLKPGDLTTDPHFIK